MAGWSILRDGYEVNCTENRESDEFNSGCSSDNDNDVKWEDCDAKFRCLFDQILMVLLRGVYAKNGIRPIPALLGNGEPVDLFKLFCLVRDRGGFSSVSKERLWGLVAEKFGFDYRTSASLKLIYFKYLDELDRWLNRITRERILANGSYDCGGNLGLLSLELEKRFRDFSLHGKELMNGKDEKFGYDELCEHIDVALKESLQRPANGEKGGKLCEIIVDDDDDKLFESSVREESLQRSPSGKKGDKLCEKNVVDNGDKLCDSSVSKEILLSSPKTSSSRKRKRDVFGEMLGWMIKAAKNPCHPSIGTIPGCSKWKENSGKEFWSVSLMVREARLLRRYVDSTDEKSPAQCHQKKPQKMHPSLYKDFTSTHRSPGALRTSERLLSAVGKTSCTCCNKPCSPTPCKTPPKNNGPRDPPQPKKPDPPLTEKPPPPPPPPPPTPPTTSNDEPAIEKKVLVGPQFQADVPVWTGCISQSDPKWLGIVVWSPENSAPKTELNSHSCKCPFPGSVECFRFHIAERRIKLRRELGLAFYRWKFDRMGEEVSLSWSVSEEQRFRQIIKLNKPQLGRSFFPRKKWTDLVGYYYNVFLINRRSYQNRVMPKEIDSDDDEAEFGSVSEAFGSIAVKGLGRGSDEAMTCFENKEDTEFPDES